MTWAQIHGASSAPRKRRDRDHALFCFGFWAVAIMADLFGFGAAAFATAGMAKFLVFPFLVPFLVALIHQWGRNQRGFENGR